MKMAPQPTVQTNQPYSSARDDEYKKKYGLPGSGGWEPLKNSTRQRTLMGYGFTFSAAFMIAAFFYLFLAHLPPLVHVSFLPPSPWFLAILLALIPLTTLGAVIVNWKGAWSNLDMMNRVSTGMALALLALGISEGSWQNLAFPAVPPLQFFIMLLVTAIGATVGTAPGVSARILKIVTWAARRMRRAVVVLAVVVGAGLGFALTNGFAYGLFSLLGIALGVGVAMLLVRCADSQTTQNYPTP
jgi:hypothetical protein